jgi:hypothetical protein
MWEAFPASYLNASIKGSLNGNTFCGMRSVRCDGSDQAIKFISFFLQFFY